MLCSRSSASLGCILIQCGRNPSRLFSSTNTLNKESYKVVVLGGGTGGSASSCRFAAKFGKGNVAVLEPSKDHYYQPMWTLVGGGMKTLEQSRRDTEWCLHKNVSWIKESAGEIHPERNTVVTTGGKEIEYEYLIVALGIQLRYDLIKGLPEAFETPGVCSNYHPSYVNLTDKARKELKDGNAIFTFPATPIKCAGAPQKICYITDDYLRKQGLRDKVEIFYNTSLPVIFGVKKYAAVLEKLCEQRNIHVNKRHNLVEVKPDSKEAVFAVLDEDGKAKDHKTFKYSMLHVAAPCSAPELLRQTPSLTDPAGFLDVRKETLQSTKFPNIFGIGDCTNSPNAKTGAAVAGQAGVLYKNMSAVMQGNQPTAVYDGYTSCPLVTGYKSCILAEFDYNLEPLETFPFDQGKERRTMFHFKRDIIPPVYWHMLIKGWWNGPGFLRKMMHLGMSK